MKSQGIALLLVLVPLCLITAQNTTATVDEGTTNDDVDVDALCPPFRSLDLQYPNTPIYEAPDGCRCFDGLRGLNCGFCDSDEPCQRQDSSLQCRKDFIYNSGDTSKSYFCRLAPSLASLLDNGKVSIHFDLESLSAQMVIFNTRSVNDYHFIQCDMADCSFEKDSSAAQCNTVSCSCNENLCDDTFKATVASFNGQVAYVQVDDYEDTQKLVSVDMDGSTFPIEAICEASSCAKIASLTEDVEPVDTGDSSGGVLNRGYGIFLVVSFLPFLIP